MSDFRVKLNKSLSENWMVVRAVFEEEVKASCIDKGAKFEILKPSIQDEFASHLLDVHRKWCETCPTPSRGRRVRLNIDVATDGCSAARGHRNPSKICVSTSTQTSIG